MSGKRNKQLRKLATGLSSLENKKLIKRTQKVFQDLNGNTFSYEVTQVRLNPDCQRAVYQRLKTDKELADCNTLSALMQSGYKAL